MKLIKNIIKKTKFLAKIRNRGNIYQGLPDGIDLKSISKLCLEYIGSPLKKISYEHLSSWKHSGSYRLHIKTENNSRWNLIYKNAEYNLSDIPALTDFPVFPGPPEYSVYNNPQGSLAQYLPTVYLCSELVPSKHYMYLLEDLSHDYSIPSTNDEILKIALKLPLLHQSLSEWAQSSNNKLLLKYNVQFSELLQEYIIKKLTSYFEKTANNIVRKILELWSEISTIHSSKEFQELHDEHPIHGDFNSTNILIHNTNKNHIKIIDWEWAGLGVAHADLAALLKNKTHDIENIALESFSKTYNKLSYNEHRRLYKWCQLERGLIDAAFFAAQKMEFQGEISLNLSKKIELAVARVLDAFNELKHYNKKR